MANSPSSALAKRSSLDATLMPPPPIKRIKRPPKVLDEDTYTSAISDIIARDFFPGLAETRSQQEYLDALSSSDPAWIAQAGQKMVEAMTPVPGRRTTRNSRFNTPRHPGNTTPVSATPFGYTGAATPASIGSEPHTEEPPAIDNALSLSAFQSKYTSEDNASFNDLLDSQNATRRQRYAHLWSGENKIPTARQIAYREREAKLLEQKELEQTKAAKDGKELVQITVGNDQPAKPDAWRKSKPDNSFLFPASSVDEDGLETVADVRAAASKAGPKGVNHHNTRFKPPEVDTNGFVPPSPSLNSTVIAERDRRRAERATTDSEIEYSGGETPRVNGFAFVEEDEPENLPQEEVVATGPSYRDLLAGQAADPSPFRVGDVRKREELHLRMVEKDKQAKRKVERDRTVGESGNMTPAARRLLEKVGKTPVASQRVKETAGKEMWTPTRTPRRKPTTVAGR